MVQNFFVKICCVKYEQKYYSIYNEGGSNVFYYLFMLIPFVFIKYFFNLLNCEIIYKLDNIYYITNVTHNHILPIIITIEATNQYSYNKIDITEKIEYYNPSIPINFFITNNKLLNYDFINIKYIHKSKTIEKRININESKKYLIYNLFEN